MSTRNRTRQRADEARGCGGRFRRVARAALASVVAAAALLGPGGGEAEAGPARFINEVCDSALPGGGTPSVHFSVNPGVNLVGANSCASPGGSLSIAETGPVEATFAFWSVQLPVTPGGRIESYTVSAAACAPSQSTVAFAVERNWPDFGCADSQRIFHGGGLFGDWIWLGCDGNGPACGAGTWIAAHYFAATELDPNPPSVEEVGGSLLAGGPLRGHQSVSAELTDQGGGLAEAAVLVNGVTAGKPKLEPCDTVAAHNPSVLGTVAVTSTPCPSADQLEWTLDTQSYPFHDGLNSVAVCGYDFSTLNEPNRGCSAAQAVNVDNSCTPSVVPGGELLSAQFSRSHDDSVTVAYGKGALISGRLATNAEDPVPGATLCVKSGTIGVGGRPATVGSVTTDANGEYRYKLKPGPNRELVIGYRNDSRQVARDVRYYARVRPSLKLAPTVLDNGQRVQLWGRLPGPRAGRRVVVLQANAPGSRRWITFRRATSDGKGGFSASYRFSSTTRRTRYRFRAVVPRQAGYPWVEGRSRPAEVLVRGRGR